MKNWHIIGGVEKICTNERVIYRRADPENVIKGNYNKNGKKTKEKYMNVTTLPKVREPGYKYKSVQDFFEDLIEYKGYHELY